MSVCWPCPGGLVTDKPLYQPGQLMHLRALALQSFDLKPVAGAKVHVLA